MILRFILSCFFTVLTFFSAVPAFAGRTELTTYYPAPVGEYTDLQTQTLHFQDDPVAGSPTRLIGFDYADAVYDGRLRITAGEADTGDNDQGASIDLHGNSHANAGRLDLVAGRGSDITFWTSPAATGAAQRIRIDSAGIIHGTAGTGNHDAPAFSDFDGDHGISFDASSLNLGGGNIQYQTNMFAQGQDALGQNITLNRQIHTNNAGLAVSTSDRIGANTVSRAVAFGNNAGHINITYWELVNGAFTTNLAKTFVIPHPTDSSRYLAHATLEGPEAGVYYRGKAALKNGIAEISLPPYFEALTRQEDRTILLTNINGFDRLMIQVAGENEIQDGKFTVASDNPNSDQAFYWEVKAVRKDVAPLVVEPEKDKVNVEGFGPYTYMKQKE